MTSPLVSICIPTFNGSAYLGSALESAIRQSYPVIEIVISDDNSTDDTLAIAEAYRARTQVPIKIIPHDHSTIGANWNNCVKSASGAYIKFLFQDDLLDPDCIAKMLEPFLQHANVGLAFCRRRFIYDHLDEAKQAWLSTYGNVHLSWTSLKPVQAGKKLLKDPKLLDLPRNKVGEPSAVLLHRNVFEKLGYFNTELHQALDYEFWYRVFTEFDVAFVDEELVSFRLHEQQATVVNSKRIIADYEIYPKLMYKNYFHYLHSDVKKNLFLRYNAIGKGMVRIKRICKGLLPS